MGRLEWYLLKTPVFFFPHPPCASSFLPRLLTYLTPLGPPVAAPVASAVFFLLSSFITPALSLHHQPLAIRPHCIAIAIAREHLHVLAPPRLASRLPACKSVGRRPTLSLRRGFAARHPRSTAHEAASLITRRHLESKCWLGLAVIGNILVSGGRPRLSRADEPGRGLRPELRSWYYIWEGIGKGHEKLRRLQVLFKRKPVQFLPPAEIEDEDTEVRHGMGTYWGKLSGS